MPITDVAKSNEGKHRVSQLLARWRLWAPLVLLLGAGLASIVSSPSFSACMNSHSHGDDLRGSAILTFRCVGAFVVDYNGAILAVAVWAIAFIIFVLWVYLSDILRNASVQSELIRNSVDLTRAALVSTYPPALVFRTFNLAERSFGNGQKIQVNFTVTNKGGTSAHLMETGSAVVVVQSHIPGDIAFVKRAVKNVTLSSGEASHWPASSSAPLTPAETNALWQATSSIVCVGFFTYRDDFGTIRNSGFCRRYDMASRRWLIVADPDYEFAY